MKRRLSIIVVALMLILVFVFVGCKGPQTNNQGPAPDKNTSMSNSLNSKSELLTVSAVSVGNMMSTFNGPNIMMAAEIADEVDPETNPEVKPTVDPKLEKINYYMGVVDGLLGNKAESETVDLTADEYDGKYAKKTTITIKENNNTKTYVMVYNETLKEEDKDEKENEDEEQDQEIEEEFAIEGLLIIDDVTYLFNGERTTETEVEEGETETSAEFEFTAYVAIDNNGTLEKDMNNYIDFKQEIEQEGDEVEQEFKYSIFKNNELVKTFSLEVEKDPVDGELELELIDGSLSLKYELENKADGKEFISIKATDNGNVEVYEAEVTYDENGNKVYNYKEVNGEDLGSLPEEDFDDDED